MITTFAKSKAVAYVVSIFLVGGITGGVVAVGVNRHSQSAPPHSHDIATHMRNRLTSSLDLTPGQLQQVNPILEKSSEEIQKIHAETMERVGSVMTGSYDQISALLTPEQKVKLEQMQMERANSPHRSHHFHPRPSPGDGRQPQPGGSQL
jgi:Spy/CpxP family protein refolding chaperone